MNPQEDDGVMVQAFEDVPWDLDVVSLHDEVK